MGWKRELQRMESASRKATRDHETQKRKIHRDSDTMLRRIDRDAELIRSRTLKLHQRLSKDPIGPLNVRYTKSNGFQSDPFMLEGEVLSGTVSITADSHADESPFVPQEVAEKSYRVQPLDIFFSSYATYVAIRVSNHDEQYRIRLSWFKKSSPSEGPVFLLDPRNSVYYYPRASSLTGEVLPGHPRVGVIAFEPLRQATDCIEMHISGVKLSSERGKTPAFHFTVSDTELRQSTAKSLAEPDIRAIVDKQVEAARQDAHASVNHARQKALGTGCSGMILLFVTAAFSLGLLVYIL